jgi:NAD(P)-dependent dehydrogenase (short-subunit alcohol dehydrogenase family)
MKYDLKGKNVLLTRASRGKGVPIALEFARRGANLANNARLEQVTHVHG